MENKLITSQQAVQKIEKFELRNVIKPFMREIFLDDVYVHGFLFNKHIENLNVGDELLLIRKKSPYDEYTVAVYKENERFGELFEQDERVFARLLDAGKKLTAKVKRIVILPDYSALEITISMTDL